uniref:F-box domain-containing protein n=1 Tax=Stomoxys calcitrans TaxID=35570 RepID=A0A1I8PKK5_STOCA
MMSKANKESTDAVNKRFSVLNSTISMDVYQKLLRNSRILEKILGYLSLEEQLECLRVCNEFHAVITKVLWRKYCQDLNIYKTPYVSLITDTRQVENVWPAAGAAQLKEMSEPKTCLTFEQCNTFLMQIGAKVRHLGVFSEYANFERKLGVAFRYIQVFQNLRVLSYHRIVVSDNQLALMARHCRKLQKLKFIECTCGALKTLVPGRNFNASHFIKMPQLRELMLQCKLTSPLVEVESHELHEMLSKLKLRSLIMKNFKVVDGGQDTVRIGNGESLEVFNAGIISLGFWPDFKHHMKDFRNLRKLTINVRNCYTLVNSSVLELLTTSCRKLRNLSLENCDLYIEDFGIVNSLEHLTLLSCGGFTAANLQQVLQDLPLRSLSLTNTRVLGTITRARISPALNVLLVDTIYFRPISEVFQLNPNTITSLHTIKWANGDIKDSWLLDKCPQLKKLHIPNPYLIRHNLLKMTSLEELSFTSCKGCSWCFLLLLIKNLKLRRLHAQTSEGIDEQKEVPQNACEVKTSLKEILMPFHMFRAAQDFWLDLLSLNRQMRLIFFGDYDDMININFLRDFVRSPYVCNNLKQMRICGLVMDTDYMRNYFACTLQELGTNLSHYRVANLKITIEI